MPNVDSSDDPRSIGLGPALPDAFPRLWLQVSASIYDDVVYFRLSRLQTPGGRVQQVLRERYPRAERGGSPHTVASMGLSWWVDQLDLTGRWPVD